VFYLLGTVFQAVKGLEWTRISITGRIPFLFHGEIFMSDYLKAAIRAARVAGKIQKRFYGRVKNIQFKSANQLNLVTEIDRLCEKTVFSLLKEKYPLFNYWGEESGLGNTKSGHTWLVDPLDGTTNYTHGYPFFCCSIALLKSREPIVGVVYDAMRDECFTAEKDRGAFLNGKRIHVSNTRRLSDSLVCTGFAYRVLETHYNFDNFKQFVLKARGVRRDGSAALNLAYLAAGRFDGFWERGVQAWDISAGVLLIREAGGKVTDISGGPWKLHGENAIASNGIIHKQIFEILKKGPDERRWKSWQ
jgi:myo-inositol-1(or 4)-monophosphatase